MDASNGPGGTETRSALLAGATGLIGRELLALLQASPRYGRVRLLVRADPQRIAAHPRTQVQVVDFARLPTALPPVDDVYIALGTTTRVAGSDAGLRRIDFDAVVDTARAARAGGARRLAVVSSLGANLHSAIAYQRIKGEMEAAVATLGFDSVVIARPSLLLGDRTRLGQPARGGEVWAARLLTPLMGLVPRGVRPIAAGAVAAALVTGLLGAHSGVRILTSGDMQGAIAG
jgi:uncharacterized protein YbjT (DUF2867 family)